MKNEKKKEIEKETLPHFHSMGMGGLSKSFMPCAHMSLNVRERNPAMAMRHCGELSCMCACVFDNVWIIRFDTH